MRHPVPVVLTALFAALLAGAALAAPIYKWQDAEGRIHYEDTRPAKGDVEVIKPPTVYRGESASQGTGDATADERTRKCAESREALAQGESAERMYTLDAQGNRTYLSAEEIDAHVAELREAVARWCDAS